MVGARKKLPGKKLDIAGYLSSLEFFLAEIFLALLSICGVLVVYILQNHIHPDLSRSRKNLTLLRNVLIFL